MPGVLLLRSAALLPEGADFGWLRVLGGVVVMVLVVVLAEVAGMERVGGGHMVGAVASGVVGWARAEGGMGLVIGWRRLGGGAAGAPKAALGAGRLRLLPRRGGGVGLLGMGGGVGLRVARRLRLRRAWKLNMGREGASCLGGSERGGDGVGSRGELVVEEVGGGADLARCSACDARLLRTSSQGGLREGVLGWGRVGGVWGDGDGVLMEVIGVGAGVMQVLAMSADAWEGVVEGGFARSACSLVPPVLGLETRVRWRRVVPQPGCREVGDLSWARPMRRIGEAGMRVMGGLRGAVGQRGGLWVARGSSCVSWGAAMLAWKGGEGVGAGVGVDRVWRSGEG